MINRRHALARLSALLAAAAPASLLAQADKPGTLVVPYPPGGATDVMGRLVAQYLGAEMGRSFIVDNRPGAGGNIGAASVARAPADGNTLLVASGTALAINQWLYSKLPYDPTKDFAPIGMIAAVPLVVVVNPSVPAKNIAELVALAKTTPGGMTYGSAGNGTPHHLGVEMFKAATAVNLTHVPYKGSSPAVNDLLGGQTQLMFCDIPPVLQHIRTGKLRALAVTSAKRQPALLDVPTIAESGVAGTKDFEAVAWQGLVAPAGTPKDVVATYSQALAKVMNQRELRARFAADGLDPVVMGSQEMATYIRGETDRWGKIIKAARITLD